MAVHDSAEIRGVEGDRVSVKELLAKRAQQQEDSKAAGQRGVGPDHGISRKCAVIRAR